MNCLMKKTFTALVLASLTAPAFAAKDVQLDINGVVEVELGTVEEFDGIKSSGVALATVELGIDAKISPWVSTHILLLHEDGDTEPMEVDEGTITLANADDSAFSFTGGRMYVPFGAFESNLLSDPLTLEIGETREAAVQFGFDSFVSANFFLFNGDTLEVGNDDNIEHFGFSLGMASETESLEYEAGFSYISSIGDTDSVFDVVSANLQSPPE